MKLIGLQSENEDLLNRVAQLEAISPSSNLKTIGSAPESTRAIGVETVPDSTDLSIPEFFKRRFPSLSFLREDFHP
jgi:hypothetical protein